MCKRYNKIPLIQRNILTDGVTIYKTKAFHYRLTRRDMDTYSKKYWRYENAFF